MPLWCTQFNWSRAEACILPSVTTSSEFGRKTARRRSLPAPAIACLWLLAAATVFPGRAQVNAAPADASGAPKPAVITLDDATRLAQASEPAYAAAVAAKRTAGLDKSIALAGLLPNVSYYNQGLYTEPNGAHGQVGQKSDTPDLPKFIANNGVREYFSQAMVNETLGLGPVAALRHADAAAAMASAELEIARRGLAAAVTTLFYGSWRRITSLRWPARRARRRPISPG